MVTARPALPDLEALDPAALKALILAQHETLGSRENEIENLKLLILKLRRMQFGRKSEKFDHQIAQLDPNSVDHADQLAKLQAEKQAYQLSECQRRVERFPARHENSSAARNAPTSVGPKIKPGCRFTQKISKTGSSQSQACPMYPR